YDVSPRDRVSVALISIFPKKITIPNWLYVFLLPFFRRKEIKQVEVLKTNQMSGALPAIISKVIYKKKLIVRCGYEWLSTLIKAKKPFYKKTLVYCLEFLAYKLADKIIFTSKTDKEFAKKIFHLKEEKIAIIPNYIDTDLFKPNYFAKKEPNSVCYVGRLSKEKNIDLLIKSIKDLPEVRLYLIGDGLLKNELQKQAESLGLEKRVIFLGKIENEKLPDLLNKCEVFALLSNYEGNPKALLEAMACGLVCITSDIEGVREIIQDKQNGLLLNGNEPSSFPSVLHFIKQNKELSQQVSQQARKTIESNFSLEKILAREVGLLGLPFVIQE
ncbi:glycosyltransferase, partial [Candidatus Gribaldobacteria bacterium]|nr:glycosyltransferase [Candidatus Gribaldobacteria bacterium]